MSKSPVFLERIHRDICGPFRYFMVLIDASTRWSYVCLISTRNIVSARLLSQMTKLRAQFNDYPIKTIRLENAGEFTLQTLNDYCMSIRINIEHHVAHVHTQNGLAESLIKMSSINSYLGTSIYLGTKLPVST